MTRPHLFWFLLAWPGPAAAAPAEASPAPAQRHVLVRAGATLYAAPDTGSQAMNPYRYPQQAHNSFYVNSFQTLGEKDGWLALETSGLDDHRHCGGTITELEGLKLRLFVPASQRVSATTREVAFRYKDKTAITLKAGVPLLTAPSTRA